MRRGRAAFPCSWWAWARCAEASFRIRNASSCRIRDVLRAMTSAKQACEDLLAEALAGGGSDNITIVVARALQREE